MVMVCSSRVQIPHGCMKDVAVSSCVAVCLLVIIVSDYCSVCMCSVVEVFWYSQGINMIVLSCHLFSRITFTPSN